MTPLKRVLAAAGTVLAVTTGGLLSSSATASAAAPCGLSSYSTPTGNPYLRSVHYTIRNCHGFAVKRKLDIANGNDGKCHTIRARSQVSDEIVLPNFMFVRDKKPC
jgi:hypothetical protein